MPSDLPRVLIVYNEPVLPPDHADYASEADILETVLEVERVLPPEQYVVSKLGYARDPSLFFREVERFRPDVIFNLFEGEADRSETEILHAANMEWTRIPFTGSNAATIALGRDKIRTKYCCKAPEFRRLGSSRSNPCRPQNGRSDGRRS